MNILKELEAQKKETQRRIDLIESYKPGDVWEYSEPYGSIWHPCVAEPFWEFDKSIDYRKKPEPECVYVNKYPDYYGRAFPTKENAIREAHGDVIETVKFVRAD